MLFDWFQKRRRQKLLAEPFPPAWLEYLQAQVFYYRLLSEAEQVRLRDDLRIFLAEKEWEGCGGLEVTDEMKVRVAALACLLVLGIEHDYFDRVQSVLIYPGPYKAKRYTPAGEGLYLEGEAALLGEAHYRGPVILSWQEMQEDAEHPGSGSNLVFHEFAHQLDMLDGTMDGTPPLRDEGLRRRWGKVMTAEQRRLVRDLEQGRDTLLDEQGAESEAEFFAVATESFFDMPVELRQEHPKLYDLLKEYYCQDTAARLLAYERTDGNP